MDRLPKELWVDLIGLPYKFRTAGPTHYDCYGLLSEIYRRRGIQVPYLETPDTEDGWAYAKLVLQPVWKQCEIQPGAALLFKENGSPRHVGVAIDDDLFIHSSVANGQVALDRLSRAWGRFYLGAYERY